MPLGPIASPDRFSGVPQSRFSAGSVPALLLALPPGTKVGRWTIAGLRHAGPFALLYDGEGPAGEAVLIKECLAAAICERVRGRVVAAIEADLEEAYDEGLHRFVEEGMRLRDLTRDDPHPALVPVRDLIEANNSAYLVMDQVSGTLLAGLLRAGRRFDQPALAMLLGPLLDGLARAHRMGVAHRAITPEKILLGGSGPMLIGFGSTAFEVRGTLAPEPTPYTPIERYVPVHPQGPWTDIYALGAVIHHAITGNPPPAALGRTDGGWLAGGDWPGFDPGFLAAVDAAMAVAPQQRPQTIEAWGAMLLPAPAARESPVEQRRMRRRVLGIGAGLAVLAGAALGFSTMRATQAPTSVIEQRDEAPAPPLVDPAAIDQQVAAGESVVAFIEGETARAGAIGLDDAVVRQLQALGEEVRVLLSQQHQIAAEFARGPDAVRQQVLLAQLRAATAKLRQNRVRAEALTAMASVPPPPESEVEATGAPIDLVPAVVQAEPVVPPAPVRPPAPVEPPAPAPAPARIGELRADLDQAMARAAQAADNIMALADGVPRPDNAAARDARDELFTLADEVRGRMDRLIATAEATPDIADALRRSIREAEATGAAFEAQLPRARQLWVAAGGR